MQKKKNQKIMIFLVVDFHGEITSEKMAIGNIFDGNTQLLLLVLIHTYQQMMQEF